MSGLSFSSVVGTLRRLVRHLDGNGHGQTYALTSFFPIKPGEEMALELVLAELPLGEESPLARLKQLHCSRLHILNELVYQGAPQEPEPLRSRYFIFTASFDGDLDRFLDDICDELPAEADSIWGHCVGFPGTSDPLEFKRYVKHNQIHNHYFIGPYPESTVREVQDGLALRKQVAEFAAEMQGMPAAAMQDRFVETFLRP